MSRYLAKLVEEGNVSKDSTVFVTSHPMHSGGFFSGWFDVVVGIYTMKVYGSTSALLGAWTAEDNVKEKVVEFLNNGGHCPQSIKREETNWQEDLMIKHGRLKM